MTGVVISVSACDRISPPTIVTPSGWLQFRAGPGAEHQRQRAEQRRHRRHHDRPEAQERGLVDRLARRLAFVAFGDEGEVDHHDAILLDDADEEDDADDRDDREVAAVDDQRHQGAEPGRGQRRKNRDRVDEALIKHAQHDVDGDDRREDQHHLVAERRLEGERRALEAGDHADRKADFGLGLLDLIDRGAERGAGRQVERDRDRRELPDMVDRERRGLFAHLGNRRERHLAGAR